MDIRYKKQFQKDFNKLPRGVQQHFYQRLELFLKNKTEFSLHNHAVDKAFPTCRSINITGDYRAIFKDEGDVAIFITIGTHAQLYR